MNIYLFELKAGLKKTIAWSIALALILLLFMSMFSLFKQSAADTIKIFEGFPPAFRDAFGMYLDKFFTIPGFYAFIFGYASLCGGIQAMHFGLDVITKEQRMKTADFLMTKPVRRVNVLLAKVAAALSLITLTNIIFVSASWLMALRVSGGEAFDAKAFNLIALSMFFIQVFFVLFGVMIGSLSKKIKSVLPTTLGLVFLFYATSMLGSIIGEEKVHYLTPFKFFETNYIIENGSYQGQHFLWMVVLLIVFSAVSYLKYTKREINSL